jgi:Ribosomal protein S8E
MRKSIETLSGRKLTGGRKMVARGRRKYEIDRYPSEPVVGTQKTIFRRVRGGNRKISFKSVEFANISDPIEKRRQNQKY